MVLKVELRNAHRKRAGGARSALLRISHLVKSACSRTDGPATGNPGLRVGKGFAGPALCAGCAGFVIGIGAPGADAGQSPQFIFLPPAQPGWLPTFVNGLSADGSVATGSIPMPASYRAFRWTEEDGLVILDNLLGGDGCCARGSAISRDGTTIVGESSSPAANISAEAYRWSEADGMVGIGVLDPDEGDSNQWSAAYSVSDDGSTIVGRTSPIGQAFRWTMESGVVGLGFVLPGDDPPPLSIATAVSADGSVVVGWGTPGGAFRWTASTGMAQLYPKGAALTNSDALDITPDGSTIVGHIRHPDNSREPVRWVGESMLTLGMLPGYNNCRATVVSACGAVILGYCRSGIEDFTSWVWSSASGLQPLEDVLQAHGVVIPSHLLISTLTGISDDLQTIAGQTIEPGNIEGGGGFLAKIRAPLVATPSPDMTGDGEVNIIDLLLVLGQWGACASNEPCPADFNIDGNVNVLDLLFLLGQWG